MVALLYNEEEFQLLRSWIHEKGQGGQSLGNKNIAEVS